MLSTLSSGKCNLLFKKIVFWNIIAKLTLCVKFIITTIFHKKNLKSKVVNPLLFEFFSHLEITAKHEEKIS